MSSSVLTVLIRLRTAEETAVRENAEARAQFEQEIIAQEQGQIPAAIPASADGYAYSRSSSLPGSRLLGQLQRDDGCFS